MLKCWRRYRIRKKVLHKEAQAFFRKYAMDDIEHGTTLNVKQQKLAAETLKLAELAVRINTLKSWTERSIYNSYLKTRRKKLKVKYRELEEMQIELEVKGDLQKLEEINDVLDGMLENIHPR
jgi:hypothetical protein